MRTFLALLLTCSWAIAPWAGPTAQADVIAQGDVTPDTDPDLPIFGGTASEEILVGITGTGRLTIDVPSFTAPLISPGAQIGDELTGIGEALVSGLNSEWEIQGEFIVGDNGLAFLSLVGGAQVVSTLFDDGMGMTVDASMTIGKEATSQGYVSIDGFGSRLDTSGLLTIADEGVAQIDITNRGNMLTTGSATMGITTNTSPPTTLNPSATVTLRDLGSRWIIQENLTVGNEGADGETVFSLLEIGEQSLVQVGEQLDINLRGRIDFDGGTLRTLDPTFTIENDGVILGGGVIQGSILNGGRGEIRNAADIASLRQNLIITGEVENSGLIESLGGEMEFQSVVTNELEIVARDAVMRFSGGLVNDISGDIILGGDTTLHSIGTILSEGGIHVLTGSEALIIGDLTFTGAASVANALTLAAGDSTGTLDVAGTIDLGSALLELDYSAGVASQVGDTYQILSSTEPIVGMFSNLANEVIADGRIWDIIYGTSSVSVTATGATVSTMPGDFNGDGICDGADFLVWQAGAGTIYDGNDLADWENCMLSPAVVAASAAVPEPSSGLLLVLGSLLIGAGTLGRKRR